MKYQIKQWRLSQSGGGRVFLWWAAVPEQFVGAMTGDRRTLLMNQHQGSSG